MQEQEEQQPGSGIQDTVPAAGSLARRGGRRAGFTLIELMIAVLIIGILTRLALPYFKNQIRESRRTDAKTALLDLASREERFYATNSMYTSAWTSLYSNNFSGTSLLVPDANSPTYTIAFSGTPTATSFALAATPYTTDQAKDYCGTYTLNNFGDQGNTGNTITTGCW
jgi:type IV pilus assembly protein PilE